jgi:hypothetical protein
LLFSLLFAVAAPFADLTQDAEGVLGPSTGGGLLEVSPEAFAVGRGERGNDLADLVLEETDGDAIGELVHDAAEGDECVLRKTQDLRSAPKEGITELVLECTGGEADGAGEVGGLVLRHISRQDLRVALIAGDGGEALKIGPFVSPQRMTEAAMRQGVEVAAWGAGVL